MQIDCKVHIKLSEEDMQPFYDAESKLIEILREVEDTDSYIEDPCGNEISEETIRAIYRKIQEITT